MPPASAMVREVVCKSLLNKVQSPTMPFRWSINPYRGCQHACVYCYARRYHEYLGLDPGEGFERQILVKVNAPAVLRRELSRRSWKREWVALGTAVDPYQPVEGRYRLTRSILSLLLAFETPCSVVTKNTMICRDLEILAGLAAGPGCAVYFSITTLDEELARLLEPDTPPPAKRLAAMEILAGRGVDVGVLIAPIIPGVTDSEENLRTIVRQAAAHGARHVSGAPLRLQGSVRSVFGEFLSEQRPDLIPLYEWLYPGAHARIGYRRGLERRLAELTCGYGLGKRRSESPTARGPAAPAAAGELRAARQLTLF